MKFESVLLGDVCELIAGFAFKSKDFETGEGRVIKITHITPPVVDMDNLAVVNLQNYNLDKIEKYIARQGDFVLAMTGATIGKIGRIENGSAYINQRVLMFKNHDNIDKDYLYYVLQQYEFEQYVLSHIDSQSAQPNISAGTIGKYEFDLPDLNMQKKIGKFLRLFDAKIALNNKINNNLAQQVRALIALWFAEYQPFDGSMPSDWRPILLSEIADFIPGYSYKGDELQQSTTAMASIKNFERGGGFKLDGFKEIVPSDKIKDSHSAELFDILVAHTDLTQKAEVIGNAEPVLNMAGYDKIVFSMDLVKVVPKAGISQFLLAGLLQDPKFKAHCLGYVNGTTVLHLSKKALPEYELLLPTKVETLRPLSDALESIYRKQAAVMEENRSLEVLRDALLPRLMSGEIDVSDVQI